MNFMIKIASRSFFKLILVACLLAGLAGNARLQAHAQSGIEGWSEPVNLSKSGQTILSFVAANSSGAVHAFWLDRLSGMEYAYSGPEGWSEPSEAVFPISAAEFTVTDAPVLLMPQLVSGMNDWVYFFWQDVAGLHFSSANTSEGRALTSWAHSGLVTQSSASYDVAVDADGVLHVAYVQASDIDGLDAGVYYMRSINSGANWTVPVLLYRSSYLRNLIAPSDSPLVDNSVDLSVTTIDGEKTIFVAFDNQPRKSIFITRSLDNGVTWEEARQVDGPVTGSALVSPGQIHVNARAEQVLLTWEVRQSDTVCFTYFENSDDGGASWTAGQRIYTPYSGCADQIDFLPQYEAYSLLVTTANGLSYLNAWDGKVWTGFELQSTLSSFIDPETQDNVTFLAYDWTLIGEDQLAVIGNDSSAGGDTWITTRSLADVSSWFAAEPGWKITSDLETLAGTLSDLQVVSESSEILHALWVQDEILDTDEDVLVPSEPSRVVYYSSLKNNQWTEPVQILRAPQLASLTGTSTQMDDISSLVTASGPDDRLWAVWKNSIGGEVYFSWARASAANSVVEWSDPASIPSIPVTAAEFSMAVDRGGWIHIVYSVPVNEGRGVYLVQSHDQGKTWTDAVRVFDAQSQNWERVAQPSLAAAVDGSLWVLFSHQSVGTNELASGLYAVHSVDRGATWSDVETVSSAHVLWSQMLSQSDQVLHRLWMEEQDNNQALLFHQASTDGGLTWGRVARVSDAAGSPGPAAAVIDHAGQLHLVQVLEDQQGRLLLRYWLWDGSLWSVQDDYDLGGGRLDEEMNAVAVGISPLGQLGVVASRALIGANVYQPDTLLVGLNRPLLLPEIIEATLPPLPTETSFPLPVASVTPAATATIDLAVIQQGSPSTGGGTMGGLLVALIASIAVITGGVVIAIIRVRRRNGY
jgi:hypothetical protein